MECPFGSSMETSWDICKPEAFANRNTHTLIWIWERPGKASHWGFNEGCGRNDWLPTTNIVHAWKLGHWCYLPTTNFCRFFIGTLNYFSSSMLTIKWVCSMNMFMYMETQTLFLNGIVAYDLTGTTQNHSQFASLSYLLLSIYVYVYIYIMDSKQVWNKMKPFCASIDLL